MVDVRLDFSFWLLKTIHCEFTTCPVSFFFFLPFRVPFPFVSLPQRYAPLNCFLHFIFFLILQCFPLSFFPLIHVTVAAAEPEGSFYFLLFAFHLLRGLSDIRGFLLNENHGGNRKGRVAYKIAREPNRERWASREYVCFLCLDTRYRRKRPLLMKLDISFDKSSRVLHLHHFPFSLSPTIVFPYSTARIWAGKGKKI